MPYFKWKGKNSKGKITRDSIVAIDKNDALIKLKNRGISVITIKKPPKDIEIPFLKSKVKEQDLVIITKQLSIMIGAGLPLDESLNIIAEQTTNRKLSDIIYEIKKNIESGSSFANALRKHPDVFSKLYANMIESAEASGNIDSVLKRLTSMMEKRLALKRKIKGALIYPTIVSVVAIGVIALILTFVIPTFADLYSSANMHLPLLTQFIINLSNFLKANIVYILLAIIMIAVIIHLMYKKIYKVHRLLDNLMLHLPVVGIIIRKSSISNFANILSSLSASGIDILEALDIGAKTAGNLIIEEALLDIKTSVKAGENLSASMAKTGEFPTMVIQMVSVGEETGTLDEMLGNVSNYYEEEVDIAVKNLTTMLEPLIIVFLGGAIGVLVVAMYLPIFKIGEAIK